MTHVIIRHKVADFGKWKALYDDHRSTREAAGLRDLHLWRTEEDPSDVLVLFAVSDDAKARGFADSADLKAAMEAAGVQGPPEMWFLSEG